MPEAPLDKYQRNQSAILEQMLCFCSGFGLDQHSRIIFSSSYGSTPAESELRIKWSRDKDMVRRGLPGVKPKLGIKHIHKLSLLFSLSNQWHVCQGAATLR